MSPALPGFTFVDDFAQEPLDLAELFRAWEEAHKPIEVARLAQRHAEHLRQLAAYKKFRRANPRAKWKPQLFAGR